jgi:hypothetical protein
MLHAVVASDSRASGRRANPNAEAATEAEALTQGWMTSGLFDALSRTKAQDALIGALQEVGRQQK